MNCCNLNGRNFGENVIVVIVVVGKLDIFAKIWFNELRKEIPQKFTSQCWAYYS